MVQSLSEYLFLINISISSISSFSIRLNSNFTKRPSLLVNFRTLLSLLSNVTTSTASHSDFPDCEGIPNSFYASLSRIEKILIKHSRKPAEFVKDAQKNVIMES